MNEKLLIEYINTHRHESQDELPYINMEVLSELEVDFEANSINEFPRVNRVCFPKAEKHLLKSVKVIWLIDN